MNVNSFLRKSGIKTAFSKSYIWFTIAFIVWYYRIGYMPQSGATTLIQVSTLAFMFLFAHKHCRGNLISKVIGGNNSPITTLVLLYLYAAISLLWAYQPFLSGFLSIQNILIICILYWYFSRCRTFDGAEQCFLNFFIIFNVIDCILARIYNHTFLFYHHLPASSVAAMCTSYCFGELMNSKRDLKRKRYLKLCALISIIILLLSTSSGGNAAALAGIAFGCFLSGKILICLFIGIGAWVILSNPDLMDSFILFIMPGKTMEMVETGTGRTIFWKYEMLYASQKPLFGWGFGCIERVVTGMTNEFNYPDAHSNYVGFYGSLGVFGCVLAGIHFMCCLLYGLSHRYKKGFVGLSSAIVCAIVNGYSYGFLSGKACSTTVMYFAVVILMFIYARLSKRRQNG